LQIQPTARGSEGASFGFGSHFQLLVAGKKSTDLLKENFYNFLSKENENFPQQSSNLLCNLKPDYFVCRP